MKKTVTYSLSILFALALTACGSKSDNSSAAANGGTTQTTQPVTNGPGSGSLDQVASAESQLQQAGCAVWSAERDAASRRGGVRVDCDRVPQRIDYLQYADRALRDYHDTLRAALNDTSLSDFDRNVLAEKLGAVAVAQDQVRQRIRACEPGNEPGRNPGNDPGRDPGHGGHR